MRRQNTNRKTLENPSFQTRGNRPRCFEIATSSPIPALKLSSQPIVSLLRIKLSLLDLAPDAFCLRAPTTGKNTV